jgi:hypothetical protein
VVKIFVYQGFCQKYKSIEFKEEYSNEGAKRGRSSHSPLGLNGVISSGQQNERVVGLAMAWG